MNDYGEKTDTKALMSEELKPRLQKALDHHTDGEDLLQTVRTLLHDTEQEYDDSEVLTPLSQRLEEVFSYDPPTYKAGKAYEPLNHADYRVLSDGVIVLGAEASGGKTTFMTDLARDLLEHNEHLCALIYSLDDPVITAEQRTVSQLLGRKLIKTHTVPASEITDRHRAVMDRIVVKGTANLYSIEKEAHRLKKQTNCTAVFIALDYLQIMYTSMKSVARREELNAIVKELKELQKRLATEGGCILLVLSQLNRISKDSEAEDIESMNRFRETSEVENQADVALMLSQVDKKDSGDLRRKLTVLKNKKGARGRTWTTEILVHEGFRYSPLVHSTKETGKIPAREKKTKQQRVLDDLTRG